MDFYKEDTCLDVVISKIKETPLISYRSCQLKSIVFGNSEKTSKYHKSHEQNLSWHIIRLYRLRNELVHDAALTCNIEHLTGNLRYYLTFMLDRLIDYFLTCNEKPDESKKVTKNDFFLYNVMILENLKKQKFPLEGTISASKSFAFLS